MIWRVDIVEDVQFVPGHVFGKEAVNIGLVWLERSQSKHRRRPLTSAQSERGRLATSAGSNPRNSLVTYFIHTPQTYHIPPV